MGRLSGPEPPPAVYGLHRPQSSVAAFRAATCQVTGNLRFTTKDWRINAPDGCHSATIRGVANTFGPARTELYLFGAAWPSLSQPPLPPRRPGLSAQFAAKHPFRLAESIPSAPCSRPTSLALLDYVRREPSKPKSRSRSAKLGRSGALNAAPKFTPAGKFASVAISSVAAEPSNSTGGIAP